MTNTVTEWGVRFSWGGGSHVDNYGTDEALARRVLATKVVSSSVTKALVVRTVTTTTAPWAAAHA